MFKDKYEHINYRVCLEHIVDECQYCKKLAFNEKCKLYLGMVICAIILLLLTKHGGYNEWIKKI